MGNITPKEAIANLNHLYGMVAPDIQRSIDVAIKALERPQVTVFTENADETAIEDMKAELQNVLDSDRPQGDINEQTYKDAYEQGYADGWKERYGEPDGRTKGEWKDVGTTIEGIPIYSCSICHREIYTYSLVGFPFCHCGADMRKGGAE